MKPPNSSEGSDYRDEVDGSAPNTLRYKWDDGRQAGAVAEIIARILKDSAAKNDDGAKYERIEDTCGS